MWHHFLKSKAKDPLTSLSSSGIRGGWINIFYHLFISIASVGNNSSLDTFPYLLVTTFQIYFHPMLLLWYPWPPNSMLCRFCGLCCLRIEKSTLLWGEWFQDAWKSNLIDTGQKHLSHFNCQSYGGVWHKAMNALVQKDYLSHNFWPF